MTFLYMHVCGHLRCYIVSMSDSITNQVFRMQHIEDLVISEKFLMKYSFILLVDSQLNLQYWSLDNKKCWSWRITRVGIGYIWDSLLWKMERNRCGHQENKEILFFWEIIRARTIGRSYIFSFRYHVFCTHGRSIWMDYACRLIFLSCYVDKRFLARSSYSI